LPAVQWQFENTSILDDLAYAHTSCFHQSRIRLNFDLFVDLTDLENRIDHGTGIHLKHNSRLRISSESGQRRFEPVRTNRQVRQNVGAGFIRNRVASDTRVGLRRDYLNARQHRSALIFNSTADLSCCLCPHIAATISENKQPYYGGKESPLH